MFRRIIVCTLLAVGLTTAALYATTSDDLKSAADKSKTVFLLVTEPNVAGVDQAKDLIKDAMKEVKKAKMVELDRADNANTDLVSQYRLSGAPLPLILVLASNGAIAGGMPAGQATVDQLVKMVPTPKKAEVLKAVATGQAVFITASQKKMASEAKAMGACAAACSQMQGKSLTVQINMDDKSELAFLNELKIDPNSAEPVTVVINAQGQVTGSFQGAVDTGNLIQAATKKAGGCCPGGSSSSSCGPTKK